MLSISAKRLLAAICLLVAILVVVLQVSEACGGGGGGMGKGGGKGMKGMKGGGGKGSKKMGGFKKMKGGGKKGKVKQVKVSRYPDYYYDDDGPHVERRVSRRPTLVSSYDRRRRDDYDDYYGRPRHRPPSYEDPYEVGPRELRRAPMEGYRVPPVARRSPEDAYYEQQRPAFREIPSSRPYYKDHNSPYDERDYSRQSQPSVRRELAKLLVAKLLN